jgi:hypothetical protein
MQVINQEISRRRFLGTTAMLGAGRLLGFPGLAGAEPVPVSGAIQAIDAFVNRHIRERGAPGLILGLADRNGVLAVRTYGHRDVKTGQPIGPDDLFEIGSITKSFVAISLLQLREAGKLDLVRSDHRPPPPDPHLGAAQPAQPPRDPALDRPCARRALSLLQPGLRDPGPAARDPGWPAVARDPPGPALPAARDGRELAGDLA